MTVVLEGMSPAQEQGWLVLLDLFANRRTDWTLIGGQMMFLLAVENGVTMPRTTTDMDVVINVVESPGAIRAFASQLLQQGFEFGDVSPAGTGGRFTKPADPGPGSIMFDLLAPEGLGERTDITTVRPARTVQVPGSRQALDRSQPVAVRVRESEGVVRRPSLLGALVVKAAATAIAVRSNPERDWEDAALLLSLVPDPIATRAECGRKDLRRIAKLGAMLSDDHRAWGPLGDAERRLGRATLRLLPS